MKKRLMILATHAQYLAIASWLWLLTAAVIVSTFGMAVYSWTEGCNTAIYQVYSPVQLVVTILAWAYVFFSCAGNWPGEEASAWLHRERQLKKIRG
jgi:hypothetical protein